MYTVSAFSVGRVPFTWGSSTQCSVLLILDVLKPAETGKCEMLNTFDTWWLQPDLLTKFTCHIAIDFQVRIALQHAKARS